MPIKIVGAGRTDTGVNARMMIAHFDLPEAVLDCHRFVRSLNSLVGRDIAIYSITPVHSEAHARFDACSRTYHYFTIPYKSPFSYPLSWCSLGRLDFEAMNHAAELLLQTSDFTSFAKLHTDAKTNICRVTRAEWVSGANGGMTFIITADRFLRNMVRAVVGTLVDVGRGKLSYDGFKEVIECHNRCAAGTSMPPEALFLWNIQYPYYSPENHEYGLLQF
jgi:tRNA pseudouridine38-40 synthase